MFETKYEKQSVDRLIFLSDGKLECIKNNNIETLGQLSKINKSDLLNLGFNNNEISEIDIELQRLGLSLKG